MAAAAALRDVDRLANPGADRAGCAERLSAWQRGFADLLRTTLKQFAPAGVRVADLPPELRGHYVAADGTYALYVLPRENLWARQSLARFVREVEGALRSVPGAPDATGIASNVYRTTASIERSFYVANTYALGLIFVLVLIDLRSITQTLMAISV